MAIWWYKQGTVARTGLGKGLGEGAELGQLNVPQMKSIIAFEYNH